MTADTPALPGPPARERAPQHPYCTGATSVLPRQVLPFGTFYGRPNVRRRGEGLEVSVLDADPHRVVERHTHDEAHFVFVLAGLYVSSAEGAPAVSAGPLLVYNPAGTTHRDRFEARDRRFEGRFLTLSLTPALARAMEEEGRAADVASVVRNPEAIALAARLERACERQADPASPPRAGVAPNDSLALDSLALALATTTLCSSDRRPTNAPGWLATAREMLDDRCECDVRMRDLAQAAGVHPVHLARVFRQVLGCTPSDYLRRRRVERGAALLRETRAPLSDIALRCGFVDQSHFARTFKRTMGVSPGVYRRAMPA